MKSLNHVAIILDGNGRWGVKHKGQRNLGHKQGLKNLDIIVNHSIKKKIKFLTLYTFSTENWRRPTSEIKFLFELLENFLDKNVEKLNNKNIRLKFIGSKKELSKKLIKKIKFSEKLTFTNKILQINIALNYGSKDEILFAMKNLKKKKLNFNIKNFETNLYTSGIPDPDLLIRTGNTKRLSNFLLWQLAYTEIFFVKKLWPDFNDKDFNKIIKDYYKIDRKYGGLDEQ